MNNDITVTLLTIFTGIVSSLIAGAIHNQLTRKKYSTSIVSNLKQQIVKVNYNLILNNPTVQTDKSKTNDSDSPFVLLFIAGLTYAFIMYYQVFMLGFLGFAVFIVTFLIVINLSLIRNSITLNKQWRNNWVSSMIYSLFIPVLILIEMNPIKEFASIKELRMSFNNLSVLSFDSLIEFMNSITAILYTVVGFGVLLIGVLYTIFNLVHMNVLFKLTLSQDKHKFNWLLKQTKRFRNPNKNIKRQLAFALLSFILISGLAYNWISKLISIEF